MSFRDSVTNLFTRGIYGEFSGSINDGGTGDDHDNDISTPRAISNLNITESYSSSFSGEDSSSDKSQAIPNALIREQWQVILGQDASMDELRDAIERCKDLVMNCDEYSLERKWLVRHLVELRYRLRELQDIVDDPLCSAPKAKIILGHHFVTRQLITLPTSKQYCDHCSGIIWSVVQASYICSDCSYCVHHKCLKSVMRVCAHVIATERKYPIEDICPEVGLSIQAYKCVECKTTLNFSMYQILIYLTC